MQSVRNNDPFELCLQTAHLLALDHTQDSAYYNLDNDGVIEPNLDGRVFHRSQSQASDFLHHLAMDRI